MPTSPAKQNLSVWLGAAFGALVTVALIGVLALGNRMLGLPFVPFDIFDWMARVLPGGLIRFVIETMVSLITVLRGFLPLGPTDTAAKLAEQSIAVVQFIVGGAVLGGVLAWLHPRRDPIILGQVAGLILLGFTILVESSLGNSQAIGLATIWLGLLFVAWGWLIASLIQRTAAAPAVAEQGQLSRRQFLAVSGATLAVTALGAWGLSRLFGEGSGPQSAAATSTPLSGDDPYGAGLTSGPAASPSPKELAARTAAVQGTRPELTDNSNFYRIDIDTIPPEVDEGSWQFEVNGLVDSPKKFTLDQIRAMPSQTQILTMACISNPVGGDLTSASRWTGVRAKDLLAEVGVRSSAAGAFIQAVDGFYEFVTNEDLYDERCMFVYAMNGEPLPREHGFPLRIYIPNRYGMKQPKWIYTMEMVDSPRTGYWVERGWDQEARPETVSVVDTVVVDPDQGDSGTALCGGIAWAGTRGISKVEVQIDGASWQAADLIEPPLSSLNWMLWRFAFPFASGRHEVAVRAYDGKGNLQTADFTSPGPGGATGIHSVVVNL